MDEVKENMLKKNFLLSVYACKDSDAIRLKSEKEDIRTPFFRDIDRILYSLAYIRYIDKTQVFTYNNDDHITKRIIHVQFVSKIARTIGRALNLNEDLIEAAALGHDLGHVPFGHVGEMYLNKISLKHKEGYFRHNVHSVRILKDIEDEGNGKNITIEVLDAILCHNGEIISDCYKPEKKSLDEFIKLYNDAYASEKVRLIPSTLEGCVVRVSDLIAYIGRDIEDGIRKKLIKKEDIPKEIVEVLGLDNKSIVNTIMMDIINNSIDKNYIKMSGEIYNAIKKLKKFNFDNIYVKAYDDYNKIEEMIESVFNYFLTDLKTGNKDSIIVTEYLNYMNDNYKKNTHARIVIDFIAGMTDRYFENIYQNINKV